jgi:hypothetical protein
VRSNSFATAVLLALVVSLANCAGAQNDESAKHFLESTYRLYAKGGPGASFDGPQANRIFHSSLIALVRDDQRAVVSGDVGVMDGDPVCGCQDWDGVFNLDIDVRLLNRDRANAAVSFSLFEPSSLPDKRSLIITLVRERDLWRIYDVLDRSDPKAPFALRRALQMEIDLLQRHPNGAK